MTSTTSPLSSKVLTTVEVPEGRDFDVLAFLAERFDLSVPSGISLRMRGGQLATLTLAEDLDAEDLGDD